MSLNFNFIYVKVSEVAELQSEEPNPHAIFFIWLNASWLIAPKFDLIADDNDVNFKFHLKIIFKLLFFFSTKKYVYLIVRPRADFAQLVNSV